MKRAFLAAFFVLLSSEPLLGALQAQSPVTLPDDDAFRVQENESASFPSDSVHGEIRGVSPSEQGYSWVAGSITTFHGTEAGPLLKVGPTGRLLEEVPLPSPWKEVSAIASAGDERWLLSVIGESASERGLFLLDKLGQFAFRPAPVPQAAQVLVTEPAGTVISMHGGGLNPVDFWRLNLSNAELDEAILSQVRVSGHLGLAVTGSGSIWLGGNLRHPDFFSSVGRNDDVLWKLQPDGVKDPNFPEHKFIKPLEDFARYFNLLAQPDGKVVASGAFTNLNGQPVPPIVRFLSDGGLDPSFRADLSVLGGEPWVFSSLLQANGELVFLVGNFRSRAGDEDRGFIIKLAEDGTLIPGFTRRCDAGVLFAHLYQLGETVLLANYHGLIDGTAQFGFTRFFFDGTMSTSGPAAIHALAVGSDQLRFKVQVRLQTPFLLQSSSDLEKWELVQELSPVPELQQIEIPRERGGKERDFFRLFSPPPGPAQGDFGR